MRWLVRPFGGTPKRTHGLPHHIRAAGWRLQPRTGHSAGPGPLKLGARRTTVAVGDSTFNVCTGVLSDYKDFLSKPFGQEPATPVVFTASEVAVPGGILILEHLMSSSKVQCWEANQTLSPWAWNQPSPWPEFIGQFFRDPVPNLGWMTGGVPSCWADFTQQRVTGLTINFTNSS